MERGRQQLDRFLPDAARPATGLTANVYGSAAKPPGMG